MTQALFVFLSGSYDLFFQQHMTHNALSINTRSTVVIASDKFSSIRMSSTTITRTNTFRAKVSDVLKCNAPKLVPFFKTVAIFFILFPKAKYKTADLFYLVFKCLPILSLILFIFLNGINLRGFEYSYSRRILTGLAFSLIGDALLVYDHAYFIHGIFAFGISHILYATAYGMRPLRVFMLAALLLPVVIICLVLSGVVCRPLSYVVSRFERAERREIRFFDF